MDEIYEQLYLDLTNKINQIYLDVKFGSPKVKAMYTLTSVMEELNELAGNKP